MNFIHWKVILNIINLFWIILCLNFTYIKLNEKSNIHCGGWGALTVVESPVIPRSILGVVAMLEEAKGERRERWSYILGLLVDSLVRLPSKPCLLNEDCIERIRRSMYRSRTFLPSIRKKVLELPLSWNPFGGEDENDSRYNTLPTIK